MEFNQFRKKKLNNKKEINICYLIIINKKSYIENAFQY